MIAQSLDPSTSIPVDPGLYALELQLKQSCDLVIGALGQAPFPAGSYFYIGSARGPGGLRARILRHLRVEGKRLHWHVDHLLTQASIKGFFWTLQTGADECELAEWFAKYGDRRPPRFGASDCSCPGHLVYMRQIPAWASFPGILWHLSLQAEKEDPPYPGTVTSGERFDHIGVTKSVT